MANKVKFGLKNVHYAVATENFDSETGKWTTSYGAVKAWPGAVSMSLSAEGSDDTFHADDIAYYVTSTNGGYTGDFESALMPSDVAESVLGQKRDDNGLLVETASDVKKYIALMFEVQGDSKAARYCFYRVMLTRPNVDADTKGDTTEPKTDSVSLVALPRLDDDHCIKSIADDLTTTGYDTFFSNVPVPSFS